jgi:NAD(P)H dehydrogenase (quinone)
VLALIQAPAKPADVPIATTQTLREYDAFIFGVPTRYGNLPSQWSSFWDATGALWASGALYGKPAGVFVSTGTAGGGQELTVRSILSILTHHGIIYVPLGYRNTFAQLSNLSEVHGGSAWGAGTFAGGDGSRQATELELEVATIQGSSFYEIVKKFGITAGATTAGAAGAAAPVPVQEPVVPAEETSAENKPPAAEKPAVDTAQARKAQATPAKPEKSGGCGCTIM